MDDLDENWRQDPKHKMIAEKFIHRGKEWIRYHNETRTDDFELRDETGKIISEVYADSFDLSSFSYMLSIRNTPSSKLEISRELFDHLHNALDAGNSNYDIYKERVKIQENINRESYKSQLRESFRKKKGKNKNSERDREL